MLIFAIAPHVVCCIILIRFQNTTTNEIKQLQVSVFTNLHMCITRTLKKKKNAKNMFVKETQKCVTFAAMNFDHRQLKMLGFTGRLKCCTFTCGLEILRWSSRVWEVHKTIWCPICKLGSRKVLQSSQSLDWCRLHSGLLLHLYNMWSH